MDFNNWLSPPCGQRLFVRGLKVQFTWEYSPVAGVSYRDIILLEVLDMESKNVLLLV